MPRTEIIGAVALLGFALCAEGVTATDLVLRDLVAQVVIVPESRSDIEISIRPGTKNAPRVDVDRDVAARTVVSSSTSVSGCSYSGGVLRALLSAGETVDLDDAARILIRVPRAFSVNTGNSALLGQIGPAESIELSQGGCGHWELEDVAGALTVEISAGSRMNAGFAGSANLLATAGGRISVAVVDAVVAEATGGGVIRLGSVAGNIRAVAGAGGSVDIAAGKTSRMQSEGSAGGRITHNGEVDVLYASATSGAQIRVARVRTVTGRITSAGGQISFGR